MVGGGVVGSLKVLSEIYEALPPPPPEKATVPKCTFLIIIRLSDCLIPIDFTC